MSLSYAVSVARQAGVGFRYRGTVQPIGQVPARMLHGALRHRGWVVGGVHSAVCTLAAYDRVSAWSSWSPLGKLASSSYHSSSHTPSGLFPHVQPDVAAGNQTRPECTRAGRGHSAGHLVGVGDHLGDRQPGGWARLAPSPGYVGCPRRCRVAGARLGGVAGAVTSRCRASRVVLPRAVRLCVVPLRSRWSAVPGCRSHRPGSAHCVFISYRNVTDGVIRG